MTAAGLAVAIPAVLGYNVFGRVIGRIEADLEGFARDLRELLGDTARSAVPRAMPVERSHGLRPHLARQHGTGGGRSAPAGSGR